MKVSRQLAALEPMVLHPLRQLEGEDWHRTVLGKWSIAQIVRHLAIGIDYSAATLEKRADRKDLKRRATPKQTLLRHLYLGLGHVKQGRDAPEGTVPEERPDPEATLAQFRMGVARLETMITAWPEERQLSVFAKNPALGDLNLPEWVRFHFVHCRHHAKQIQARLRWLGAKKAKAAT
jgi:hypothetical protein